MDTAWKILKVCVQACSILKTMTVVIMISLVAISPSFFLLSLLFSEWSKPLPSLHPLPLAAHPKGTCFCPGHPLRTLLVQDISCLLLLIQRLKKKLLFDWTSLWSLTLSVTFSVTFSLKYSKSSTLLIFGQFELLVFPSTYQTKPSSVLVKTNPCFSTLFYVPGYVPVSPSLQLMGTSICILLF